MSSSSFPSASTPALLDADRIRRDFPLLDNDVNGRRVVYLDNAATTQKPRVVIDRIDQYYREDNANVHRGVYALSARATQAYERGRASAAGFVNASDREIVFVRGATEAINLVAGTYGRSHVGPGDEVVVSEMEHHSNIVPWQSLCEERRARLVVIPVSNAGELDMNRYAESLTERTRIVAVVHVSNVLGTINPVSDIVALAHERGVPVLVDGAQSAGHIDVDVRRLGCDFYVWSGHKMFGPTGIGALYGRFPLLDSMPPYQTGGDMIESVSFRRTTYRGAPHRFEAGTPDIAGAVGFAAAIEYVTALGLERIAVHERALADQAATALAGVPGVHVLAGAAAKTGILSFVVEGVHPHDVATIVDREGLAVRAGHHCCQPLMERLGVAGTTRASFACYNTREDVDALAQAVRSVREVFT